MFLLRYHMLSIHIASYSWFITPSEHDIQFIFFYMSQDTKSAHTYLSIEVDIITSETRQAPKPSVILVVHFVIVVRISGAEI